MYIRIVLTFWLVKLTKKQGAYVDSQFWQFRGRPVRPVCPVVIRVGFVLFWKFLYKPTWRGVRLPRPINIKAKADWGYSQSNQYKNRITFISQTLAFSNHRLLSSFVSTAFEDVLSGLPTSEQPYVHELRRGPSRARCYRYSRVPCLHWSDRSSQGFRCVDHFDDRRAF